MDIFTEIKNIIRLKFIRWKNGFKLIIELFPKIAEIDEEMPEWADPEKWIQSKL